MRHPVTSGTSVMFWTSWFYDIHRCSAMAIESGCSLIIDLSISFIAVLPAAMLHKLPLPGPKMHNKLCVIPLEAQQNDIKMT